MIYLFLPLRKLTKNNIQQIMGFPIGYTELFVPDFIINTLTVLGFIHNLISSVLRFTGLLETESLPDHAQSYQPLLQFRILLPVVNFSELVDPRDRCVVCLYEFDAGDDIRGLSTCKHVFHRCCIDRWMDHGRTTCPLCRTPFVTDDLQDSCNERLWGAYGIADYESLAGS